VRISISASHVNQSLLGFQCDRRLVHKTVAWLLALLGASAVVLSPPSIASAQGTDVSGTMVIPRESWLVGLDMATGVEQRIPLSGSGTISDVAADSNRIALSRLARRADGALGRDIVVLHRDGGEPERIIEHDSPRVFLGSPTLRRDGQAVIYDRQDPSRPPAEARIEEVLLADGARRTLAERGRFPTIHPDGFTVAFVRWGVIESLVVRSLTTGVETAIVENDGFLAIASPRFSPDGAWIAFAAVGEAMAWRKQLWLGAPTWGASLSMPVRHGFSWEIWRVRPDGSDLERLTELGEDEPTVAWSPDGRALAVHGGLGLTIIDISNVGPPRQVGPGGFGSIGWLPPL